MTNGYFPSQVDQFDSSSFTNWGLWREGPQSFQGPPTSQTDLRRPKYEKEMFLSTYYSILASHRFANCDERHLDGHHSPDEHRLARPLRHHHLLHHWTRAVHGRLPQNLLRCYHRCREFTTWHRYIKRQFFKVPLFCINVVSSNKKEKYASSPGFRRITFCSKYFVVQIHLQVYYKVWITDKTLGWGKNKEWGIIWKSLTVEHGKTIISVEN